MGPFLPSLYYLTVLLGTYYLWPQKSNDFEVLKRYYGPSVWVNNKLQLKTENGYRGVYTSRLGCIGADSYIGYFIKRSLALKRSQARTRSYKKVVTKKVV